MSILYDRILKDEFPDSLVLFCVGCSFGLHIEDNYNAVRAVRELLASKPYEKGKKKNESRHIRERWRRLELVALVAREKKKYRADRRVREKERQST